MEAKQKNHPKASVVMAKKPVHRGAKTAKEGAAASVKAYSPFKTVRGIVALVLFVCALFALLSMVLWTKFPGLWQPIVLPGKTLLTIFSWAAYYLPMWLLWAAVLVYIPRFCPRTTYLLGSSALPFVVLTGFARISTNPGGFFEQYPAFTKVGLSSLYAALGFLLAASLMLVIAGYVKLSEWLKANGFIKVRNEDKGEQKVGGFGQKAATFFKNISMKREERRKQKEEARLARAEALAQNMKR